MSRPLILVSAGPSFNVDDYPKLLAKGDVLVLNYAHQGIADNPNMPLPKAFICADDTARFRNDWYANPNVLKIFARKPTSRCLSLGLVNYESFKLEVSTQWDHDYFNRKRKDGSEIPKRILQPFKTIVFAVQWAHHFGGYKRLAFYGSDMQPTWWGDSSRLGERWYGVGDLTPEQGHYIGKAQSLDTMTTWLRWQSRYLWQHGYEWTSLTPDSALNNFMGYSRLDLYE